jgi:hypothetical protein
MNNLSALRERVEKAEGPDRELDAVIWLALIPGVTRRTTHVAHWQKPYDIDETRDETGRLINVPHYTASIDAAVALIERKLPGCGWSITRYENPNIWTPATTYIADVTLPGKIGDGAMFDACSNATPALALIAALLNALENANG